MKDKYAYGLFGPMSYSKYSYFQLRRLYFLHTSLICKFSVIITLWTMYHLSTNMLFTSDRRDNGDTEGACLSS